MKTSKLEIFFHVLFWIFLFSAVNIEWTQNWFDASIRPKTPAPLSFLIFPILFYVNAFFIIPKYFQIAKWKQFIFFAFLLFILPELIRCLIYISTISDKTFMDELFSRDSFIFGAPSPVFMALNTSFIYRLTKDWLVNKSRPERPVAQEKVEAQPYENTNLLTPEEVTKMSEDLKNKLRTEEAFLNSELTLRELAASINTSEKKLSFLLNQKMNTNFYELLNTYRVEKFKTEVKKDENKNLSIVGLALNCGFQSKSSFYRAFKSQVGSSPSKYLKENS